jgi:transcription elongation GreA/GreB family factor
MENAMSRAVVWEPDSDVPPEPLPKIPVPPPPNPVTARKLSLIEVAIADIERQVGEAGDKDPAEIGRLRRELRYWLARQASAHLVPPPDDPGHVGFGSRVTVDWPGRGPVVLQIVGDDEADPASSRVGWRAPVAAALIGNGVGDVVEVSAGGRTLALTIRAVDNRPST